ncbi:MAG: YihY/virulence factor BrkB family protein [Chitinophagaceae bacterium]
MKNFFKNTGKIFKQSFNEFGDYKITSLSAALAYYTIFSIAPMLIIIINLCDIFFGRTAVEGRIYGEIKSFVGQDAAIQIQTIIRNAAISGDNVWATTIGIIALVFAATGVFAEIQSSINLIWNLKAKPKKGFMKIVVNRLASFSMIITLGFISLVSLVLNALLDGLSERLVHFFPKITVYVIYGINLALTFAAITFLFAIIFKVLPDAKIQWKDVWMGAFTTAILFMAGKFAISFYLSKTKVASTYGAAGSTIIILLWVYYSSIILYFGAAFTKAYAQFTGRHIYPNDYAVFIQQIEKESKQSLQAQPEQPKTVIEEKK